MENYSTLSRDRVFRKRSLTTVIFGIVAIVILYGVIFSVENYFGGSTPQGENGSSYATVPTGDRAWSELLEANGIGVTRDRGDATLPVQDIVQNYDNTPLKLDRVTQTIVVLGGALTSDEAKDAKEFIRNGGRLITDNPYLLNGMLGDRVSVLEDGTKNLFASSDNVSGMDGIHNVAGSGIGSLSYESNDEAQSLLTDNTAPTTSFDDRETKKQLANAAIFRLGSGDVIALVDTGVVANAALPKKDNALFALRIAGSKGSHVTFIEGVHGFDDAHGYAGMPLSWRIAIVGLFAAFVVFGCAQGRRFGVGEEPNRNLGPRRIYFAHALAQALKKANR